MSKKKDGVRQAFEKGYRVINGNVVYNGNIRKLYSHIKRRDSNTIAYYSFGIRSKEGSRIEIYVHQLMAYQKFGEESFDEDIEVRHIDGNSLNNKEENILIGSKSQNRRDYLALQHKKLKYENLPSDKQ
jgi:hypothetical protein